MRIGPFGIWEILIILALVLMLFGPRKLPELARGIGQAINEFRRGVREISSDLEREMKDEPKPRTNPEAAQAQKAATDPAVSGGSQPTATEPASATADPTSADQAAAPSAVGQAASEHSEVRAPAEPDEAGERQVRS